MKSMGDCGGSRDSGKSLPQLSPLSMQFHCGESPPQTSSDSSDESSDSKDSTDSDRESVNDRGASFLKNSHGDNGDDQETEVCTNVSLSDDDDVLSQIIKDCVSSDPYQPSDI